MRRFEFDAYPPWLAELAQLFSEFCPLHPGLPPAGEPDWARARLFEALETLLLRLAEGASATILCLDDLHLGRQRDLGLAGVPGATSAQPARC